MFTGIVEETGVIRGIRKNRESAVVSVKAGKVLEDLKIGDSVASGRIFSRRLWSRCNA